MLDTSARLLSLLQGRRDWAGPDLAGRLGVTSRTLRRDVRRLRDLGYPVHGTPGAAGGYRLGAGGVLPPLLLDDDEAVAVALGLRTAAGGTVTGIEESSVRALTKLEQVLPVRLRHLVARDLERNDWRTLRVDRIGPTLATGERFVPRDPPDAAAFVAHAVGVAPYRYRARVRLHAPAGVVAEFVPPAAGVIEAVDEQTRRRRVSPERR